MNDSQNPFHIILCTDASPASESAAAFLRLFTFPPGSQCTLLGIRQSRRAPELSSQFDRVIAALGNEFELQKETVEGNSFEAIARYASRHPFDLVALGDPPGAHSRPFQPGFLLSHHLADRLASSAVKPLLVVRTRKPRLNNVLFCTSGEEPARRTFEVGARMLSNTGARFSILHVMSQIAFENSRFSADLYYTAETAIQSGSREGIHLAKAVEILSQAGVKSQAVPRLRHGLVMDEVNAEIKEQQIDLLVIGSHRQPGQNRFLRLMLEDVARDLVNEAQCSILVV